jgi:hypothetical protein
MINDFIPIIITYNSMNNTSDKEAFNEFLFDKG